MFDYTSTELDISSVPTVGFSSDYELYNRFYNASTGAFAVTNNPFNPSSPVLVTIGTWFPYANAAGWDLNSTWPYPFRPVLDANYVPLPGVTNGVGAGTNLTVYGITNDINGFVRPASGNWTIGAFQGTNSPQPPAITVQPANVTTLTNTTASFTLTAVGDPTLYYQWQFTNGVAVTNWNQSASWTTNSGTAQTNWFQCIVTNATTPPATSTASMWMNTNGLTPTYTLTVTAGTGSASGLTAGQVVTISTNSTIFIAWTGPGAAFIAGQTPTTTLTMAAGNTSITANYTNAPPPVVSGTNVIMSGSAVMQGAARFR